VQDWADDKAPDGTQVISLSHCWESREHCDPYGYHVSKLAKALKGEEWVFIDYVSLYQFQRLSQQQNLGFKHAMLYMHVLYCHDGTSTLRIESLTPEEDIAEAKRKQDSVTLYHHPTGLVKPVPVSELVENRTLYGVRGWCVAEREWSSTRTATDLSREIDSPEGEKGGMAPMLPEAFKKDVAGRLIFTHLDDVKTVCRLQAEVYKEKAEAASGLDRPHCRSLEIINCELRPKLPLLLKALEKIKLKLRQLHLQQNQLFEEGTRQVIEALALQSNGTLEALSLGYDGIGVANVKALAEAIKHNRTLKQLSLAGTILPEEGAFALLEALQTSCVEPPVDLTDCDWGDLGKAHVALARALRTGQVKGTVTHPALQFLSKLEARVLSLKRGEFFITSGQIQSVSQRSVETGTPPPPTRHDLAVTFAQHNRSLPGRNGALRTAPAAAARRRRRTQDYTLTELEEAQKLELVLNGRGLSFREAPGPGPHHACAHRGDGEFRKLFEPLCRALPELAKLRELSLDLSWSDIGPRPGGLFGVRGAGRILLLALAGDGEARALAAGLGQRKGLERLELNLDANSMGRGPQPRSSSL
ncbi:Nlrc3, partial [Symbiodinium necroappetens]